MNEERIPSFEPEPLTQREMVKILKQSLESAATAEERSDIMDDLHSVCGMGGGPGICPEYDDEMNMPGVLCGLLRRADAKVLLHDAVALVAHLREAWPPYDAVLDPRVEEAWQGVGKWMLRTCLLPELSNPELNNLEFALHEVRTGSLPLFQTLRSRCEERSIHD